ncbi:hypothetical protein HYPSUDRAFT_48945 [Hypholoma sublateritium FD-334 SS-4]|uniref:Uncharacterized protein n=1 Tax=Hypholoma sublateritium (strain FD-334 SS-4) TaxID=945553 RepID=A0A0D2N668_HYPSF|nr:hypothetical protein HYPSUDRAFT_48945 [Hypholoma sublateritium FD-334 SS-4]
MDVARKYHRRTTADSVRTSNSDESTCAPASGSRDQKEPIPDRRTCEEKNPHRIFVVALSYLALVLKLARKFT